MQTTANRRRCLSRRSFHPSWHSTIIVPSHTPSTLPKRKSTPVGSPIKTSLPKRHSTPPPIHGHSTKRSPTKTSIFRVRTTCQGRPSFRQWISSCRNLTSSETLPNPRRKSSPGASYRSRIADSSDLSSSTTRGMATSLPRPYTDHIVTICILMNEERKKRLLERVAEESRQDRARVDEYLNSLVVKRNRTSLVMNSFMHNVVDIENSVETTQ